MAKVSEIVRRIKKQTNCYLLREGGNHEIWLNPDTGKEFQIPRHYSKELVTVQMSTNVVGIMRQIDALYQLRCRSLITTK